MKLAILAILLVGAAVTALMLQPRYVPTCKQVGNHVLALATETGHWDDGLGGVIHQRCVDAKWEMGNRQEIMAADSLTQAVKAMWFEISWLDIQFPSKSTKKGR